MRQFTVEAKVTFRVDARDQDAAEKMVEAVALRKSAEGLTKEFGPFELWAIPSQSEILSITEVKRVRAIGAIF